MESRARDIARAAYPRVLATLARISGDLHDAERVARHIVTRALPLWRRRGAPGDPVTWLLRSAAMAGGWRVGSLSSALAADDLRRLIGRVCQPELRAQHRAVLMLDWLGGLDPDEIAAARGVAAEQVHADALAARRHVRQLGDDRAIRADHVERALASILSLFNDGYAITACEAPVRIELCETAVRIARMVHGLYPGEPEVSGLLALLLFQHARRRARLDTSYRPITLDRQDRRLWDRELIAEASALVELSPGRGPYSIKAAIAALHAAAGRYEDTDWEAMAELYAALAYHEPLPAVLLSQALAIGMTEGPRAGLAVLERHSESPHMARYHSFHAVQGNLLQAAGDLDGARQAFERALALAPTDDERAYLSRAVEVLSWAAAVTGAEPHDNLPTTSR